ncbi:hypothetical protein ALQ93_00493 [Pseudomonas syringae pv. pisi]|uniref:Uncharacterized protein n=3 Tax=Pseudomonas syringae group TaxID=136849 RepID=A0A3M3BX59_PSESJ|nr:hypothetical protein ALQ93_00493 [Pseudomonas syringae pv. pisi]RMU79107.1 hypothetical protein ALP24_03513 [Pseudomonas syringae pv. aptata]RMU80878.1 hypothetical protein ALP21_00433 [Pseudomonas savastanoi pv. phaseolicola]RML62070.1 hypothetical protein ALQ92_03456 [Pseudomonas syringae pv. pisi]RMM17309.1 hypothetical protein ALQ82_04352 [Pseudomonas syringae pv. pisi]
MIPYNAQSKAMTIKPIHLNLYYISHKKWGYFSALQSLLTTTFDKNKDYAAETYGYLYAT